MIESDELLLALNQLENIVVVSDNFGKIRYVNKAFVDKYGYTREEVIGKNPNILKTNYHDKSFYREMWRTILNGETWEGIFRNKTKSGRLIWETAKISPIQKNGDIRGFIAVKEDITYKKELEEQFHKEKFLLDELFDNAPVGIILFKPIYTPKNTIEDLIIVKANPIAGAVFNKLGIVGLRLKNILPDFPEINKKSAEMLSFKQTFEHHFLSIGKHLNMRTFPLGSERFCMFVHDITEYKNSISALEESEHRYLTLVEDSPALIRRFNKQGIISYVNGAYAGSFNKTPEQLIGTNLFNTINKEKRQDFINNLNSLSSSNPFIEYEQENSLSNGNLRWYKWVDRALLDSTGNIIEYQSVGMDFTQVKSAESLLEQQKNRLDTIFENSIMGIGVINNMGKVVLANKRLKELLEYSDSEDIIGINFYDHILESNIKDAKKNFVNLFSGKQSSINVQRKYVKRDGTEFWADLFGSPISIKDGKIEEAVALIIDITRKHEIEEELKLSEQKLKKLNNTKDKLFSVIAHDIRNPFNAILGFSTLLEKNIDSFSAAEIKEFAQKIVESSEQTYKLLEDLLTWAKSQLGQLKVNPQTFSIRSAVTECMENVSSLANSKNIDLRNMVPEEYEFTLDLEMFKLVIRNLLHNGIKFSHPNSKVKCGIIESPSTDTFTVFVKDYGIGIRPEKQKILFDLDQFLTTVGTSSEKGTGLGLSLSKEMIELNKGTIEVISKENEGSEFRLTLPRTRKASNH
ncbi:PAS domain S-box protein [Labilibacter sediminis]|nr:PAS domain S-box protein [Labilibacter sediminis]